MKRLLTLGVVTIALGLISACSSMPSMSSSRSSVPNTAEVARIEAAVRARADYWQRAEAVSAQYMTGPKAQHQLHKDLASCVAEVRELVRLGSIRAAMPPQGVATDPGLQQGWQSPTRDGPLYTEYMDFQDFDGCMVNKGWERVDFVRPVIADRAASNYNQTILGGVAGRSPRTTARYGAHGEDQRNDFNQ